ncbi:MAG: NifB/NifX family molybdenum-iron cluster-binding protein [Sphaerochaetaceae bacterium]|nr:NifB/NifX family molybdenum-iron cluster-binding protein [Sphaerochaetaceae bacterium]
MESLIVAFGSNDGIRFTDRHFGDSNKFYIYEINEHKVNFIKQIVNNSEEEKIHADPKKAGSIAKILKNEKVNVVVSKHFGANILKIKKNFVCILANCDNIDTTIENIKSNNKFINNIYLDGEDRGYIVEKNDLSLNYVKK